MANLLILLANCSRIIVIKELKNMSEAQIQAIKDVIKMTPRLSTDCLNSIKTLMEKTLILSY